MMAWGGSAGQGHAPSMHVATCVWVWRRRPYVLGMPPCLAGPNALAKDLLLLCACLGWLQYATLQEGIDATIDIYMQVRMHAGRGCSAHQRLQQRQRHGGFPRMCLLPGSRPDALAWPVCDFHAPAQVLLGLINERELEVFVHPIAPVLNETRPVVKAFAARLKKAVTVTASSQRAAAAKGRLHYLDFFDSLLSPDGQALADDLGFDGTHMSPVYLQYLRAELDRI